MLGLLVSALLSSVNKSSEMEFPDLKRYRLP